MVEAAALLQRHGRRLDLRDLEGVAGVGKVGAGRHAKRRHFLRRLVGLQVVAFATSYWYFSVPRATLLWWPLWIGLATVAARRRWVMWVYLSVSVPLMAIWAATFLTGRWAG